MLSMQFKAKNEFRVKFIGIYDCVIKATNFKNENDFSFIRY